MQALKQLSTVKNTDKRFQKFRNQKFQISEISNFRNQKFQISEISNFRNQKFF